MTTVVNNPGSSDSGSGMGMIVGILVLLAVVFLFIFYGLPALRQPSTPSISVPDQLDVNINQPK